MTKLTYNIYSNKDHKTIAENIKTLPQARQIAEENGNCEIQPIYATVEIKTATQAKHRLVAHF